MAEDYILEQTVRGQVAHFLSLVLADTYVLYTKTQNFHWNIIDPRFHPLHKFLEELYRELANAVDEIAERIRMLGEHAPATLKQFLEMTSLTETHRHLSGDEMLKDLLKDHATLCTHIRKNIGLAQELGDEGTGDLLIQRLRAHEKAAWMIRSHFVNLTY